MVDKRLFKKLPLLRKEIEPPSFYGHSDPEIVITGWGSTYGVIKEAVDELSSNWDIAMLHFSEIYPLPPTNKFNYLKVLKNAKMTICVENNATGQFARLIRTETGYSFNRLILLIYPNPTSSTIITIKPAIAPIVAKSVFPSLCDSGINSSTTTKIIAPAAKLRA